jgi:uncharacterized protein (TIGR00369 family)
VSQEELRSPYVEFIGGRLEEMRDGCMRVSLVVETRHTNPHGALHGGVLTSLMDEVVGGAIASLRGIEVMMAAPHVTVEMNVSFLGTARPGDEMVVEGRVLRLGGTVAFAEAETRRRSDGELLAKGRFAYVILSRGE